MVLVMLTDESFRDSIVFDGADEVDVEAVTAAFDTVEVVARGRLSGAECPDCGRLSDRVQWFFHSVYGSQALLFALYQ